MNITITNTCPQYYKKIRYAPLSRQTQVSKSSNNSLSFLSKKPISNLFGICPTNFLNFFSFADFIKKNGKVTKEEYEEIKRKHPGVIEYAKRYCEDYYEGLSTPKSIAEIAIYADKYFKNTNDNYRIISIGTSPSVLTEQLAAMGHEVVFLPVSGLRQIESDLERSESNANPEVLNLLMQYLETKNINDGKKNIVLDYTSSGNSLKAITSFIKEYFSFDDNCLSSFSLNAELLNARDLECVAWSYKNDLSLSKVQEISNTPHYPVTKKGYIDCMADDIRSTVLFNKNASKEEIFDKFESYSTPLARCFSLCTMYEIDKLKQQGNL